jgi:hypothetical protein
MADKTEFMAHLQQVRADMAEARAEKARQDEETLQKAISVLKESVTPIFASCGVILTDNDFLTSESTRLGIAWDIDTILFPMWTGVEFAITEDLGVYLYNPTSEKSNWINFDDVLELAELVGEEI